MIWPAGKKGESVEYISFLMKCRVDVENDMKESNQIHNIEIGVAGWNSV